MGIIRPHNFVYFLIIFLFATALSAAEYHIESTQSNEVMFFSKGPLGEFEFSTDKIDGYVYWEAGGFPPNDAQLKTSQLYFEVDLNSLEGANSFYNRHLREDYLKTDKYPYATYQAELTRIEKSSDSSYTVFAKGLFSIYGRQNQLDVTAIVYPRGDSFRIECKFVVLLSDYEIDIPRMLFVKIDENIRVNLNFFLKPAM
jgi:polyisoprenoid-binding protein YceI